MNLKRSAIAAIVLFTVATVRDEPVLAEGSTSFGAGVASEQEIIDALDPNSKPAFKTRGIKLSTQPPAGGQSTPVPAQPAAEVAESSVSQSAAAPSTGAQPSPMASESTDGSGQTQNIMPQEGTEAPSIAMEIQFEYNSSTLTAQAREQLNPLGSALNSTQLQPYRFRFVGHTDGIGSYEYNLGLSKRRADAVKMYVVAAFGVDPGRIVAIGRGMDELLLPQDPGNAANRRVEIITVAQ